jgi:hypothetical protein
MITEERYIEYFGVDTAPTSFIRLENLALETIKSIITSDIPTAPLDLQAESTSYTSFCNALMEQMHYFDNNSDLMESVITFGGGFSLGKFSEGSSQVKIGTNETIKRISPNTYTILLNLGLLYVGMC